MSTSSIKRQIRRFHVVVVQRTSKKCTKKSDARAELLFWSLNLLFFEVVNVVTGQQWISQTMADERCEVTSYWWKACPTVEVTWSFTYFSLYTDAPSPHKKGRGVCIQTGYTYLGLHQEVDILNLQCFCLKKIILIISANLGSRNLNGSLLYCFCTLAISSAYLLEKQVNLKLNQ